MKTNYLVFTLIILLFTQNGFSSIGRRTFAGKKSDFSTSYSKGFQFIHLLDDKLESKYLESHKKLDPKSSKDANMISEIMMILENHRICEMQVEHLKDLQKSGRKISSMNVSVFKKSPTINLVKVETNWQPNFVSTSKCLVHKPDFIK